MNLSNQLKAIRSSLGITQQQLANIIGISRRDVSNIEIGSREVRDKTLTQI
jgi:transcriptional regulator with XRE-family HTH domain